MYSSSPSSRSWKSERARVGALSRCVKTGERAPDDPDLIEARRNLCALKLEEHMRVALAATPPMTDEQIKHLIALLNTNVDDIAEHVRYRLPEVIAALESVEHSA